MALLYHTYNTHIQAFGIMYLCPAPWRVAFLHRRGRGRAVLNLVWKLPVRKGWGVHFTLRAQGSGLRAQGSGLRAQGAGRWALDFTLFTSTRATIHQHASHSMHAMHHKSLLIIGMPQYLGLTIQDNRSKAR